MEQMRQKRSPRPKHGAEPTAATLASPSQDGHTSPTSFARPDTQQENVRALEARHQALVLATGHITWTARLRDSRDGRDGVGWEGASHDWRLFTGQDGDAARGWGWLDALHPDDRERTRAAWTAAVAARDAIEMDCRVRRQDGEYRWLLVRGIPVLEADASGPTWVGAATDITARKQTEAALRASEATLAADLAQELADAQQIQRISTRLIQEGNLEALYEQVLDAAIAVMRSDMASMQMLDRDQNALRLLAWRGFAPASAAFWEWVRVDGESVCGVARRMGERVIVPDVESCDFTAGTQDLEHYRLSGIRAVQSTPLVSRDGDLIGMLSTLWRTPHQPAERELRRLDVLARQAADLIERTQTEAALAYLAAIVTSADDAIASKTLDGIVTSWNASAERLFGYTAQEMIGQSILRLFPPDRLGEEDLILARIRAGEPIEHFETVRVTKDGRPLEVSLTISPIRDNAGTIIGASKIVRDITERKRMEAALRESEEKFRTLADNIPTLAWMAHPDGHIFWYNRRWYEYTGTAPESQEGWGWQSVHDPDTLPQVLDQWQRSLATGEPFEMVFPLKGADGRFRPFLTRITPVRDEQGRVVRWFGTNVDVTDLRAAEAALRAANERMDEFLHTATHELKTPLTALQATLQLTERRLQRLLTSPLADSQAPASREALETLAQLVARNQQQVQRLTRLVNDLVDAARIQADKLEIRPAPCDLAEIVWETVTEQRAVRPERTIHLQLAHGRPVLVTADADRIGQVITNYLTNALKYSAADRPVEVTLAVDGETARTARVCVRDHGPGIPAEEQTRIWERGHRVPGIEPSSAGVGLGLGLHISREIVERHGGAVGVRSVSGQGSAFWFTLPIERTGELR
ncbi:MAG TPA: PAS domain S-box protein [Ktedonobacterales bacterium]